MPSLLTPQENPALIILDLRMPEMDGIETLRHIRKKDKKVKVIILTGLPTLLGNPDTIKDVADLNVGECLNKPIENDQLFYTVRDVLAR